MHHMDCLHNAITKDLLFGNEVWGARGIYVNAKTVTEMPFYTK